MVMKNILRLGLIGIMLMLSLLVVTNVQAGRSQYLYVDWHQVVPYGSGDPNMLGTAELDLNPGKGELCYTLRVGIFASLEQPTGATIHQAPAGQNGDLVVDLQPDFGPLGTPEASGCVHLSSSLAHDMQRNPGNYYILVTDADYPDGAARAQLTK
jgi:hypothetical protein